VCSQVATTERLLHETLAPIHQNILRPIQVSLRREKILPSFLWLPPNSFIPPVFCFHSSCLGAACEAAVAVEASCITTMLAAELLPRRLVRHGIALPSVLRMKEDQAALAKWEVLERMLRAEVENTTTLAYVHEDAEGLVWKTVLLPGEVVAEHQTREAYERERREQFEELTLL
jgi:hypothetical protein